MKVTLASPAKVNPVLRLLGKRADGMHEVETTLLAIDRCDEVTAELVPARESGGDIELVVAGEAASDDVPTGPTNLAQRGARAALDIARASGRGENVGLRLHLVKRIPSRAGLGGGSSNAAAAALAVARLLDVPDDDARLATRLDELGADVAFFHRARTTGYAVGRGRGECIAPLAPPPACFIVVLTPALECATPAVYGAVERDDLRGDERVEDISYDWTKRSLDDVRGSLENDLERPALRSHPELARLRSDLEAVGGGHFRLAGSGSSHFGVFFDEADAARFLDRLLASSFARDHGLRAAFVARPWSDAASR